MFDRVACGMMRVEPRPQVDLAALSALASLVSGALGKAPPACAGWVSDDQDRGETHARLTQGSSQVSERIGATRPVRPGGQRQPGGHADVAHAAGSDTPGRCPRSIVPGIAHAVLDPNVLFGAWVARRSAR